MTTNTATNNWNTADYYCKCDSENGWTPTGSGGLCKQVCLKTGKQSDTGTSSDECWVGTGSADPANMAALQVILGTSCVLTDATVAT